MTLTMIEITQEEFETNFDSYMEQVEKNKEQFLIRMPDGRGVVMAPIDDDIKDIIEEVIQKNYDPEISD